MLSVSALNQFFSVQGAVWTSTAILFLFVLRMWNGSPAMFAQWIAYRRAKAEERSADWDRIRAERDAAGEERDMVRDRWAACEAERIEWMGRAVRAEAALQGYGEARQRLAVEEATRRMKQEP